eukprot:COSAG02_NODE_16749_length_1058_cov_1.287800_2_plen_64_part_00
MSLLAGGQPSSGLAREMQRRGWVVIRHAVEPSTVQALCDELHDELREPAVPIPINCSLDRYAD